MASVWVERVPTSKGETRFRVKYRVGGRESTPRGAGTFPTMREAKIRRDWVGGELAACRVPDLTILANPIAAPTFREVAMRWLETRIDVADHTRLQHRSDIARALPLLGDRALDTITVADVNDLVGALVAKGLKRETIRKTTNAIGMTLKYAGRPWTEAEKDEIRLPRGDTERIVPPGAEHIEAVLHVLAARYRLPLLVLDATGMRLGELEKLAWGEVDEGRGRWLVTAAKSKTNAARWVNVHPAVFAAVVDLVPREDRTPDRPVFQGFGGDRFRTALTRACTAAGVPAFSPHDLRHRRISLLHLGGTPWARIGEHVGQRNLAVTANTYTHVLVDETELDHASLL
jgi:integrase